MAEMRKIEDLFKDFSSVLTESVQPVRNYEKKVETNIYKPEQARFKLVIWFKDGNRRYFFSYDNKHYKDQVIIDEYEGLLKLIRLANKYKGTFKNAILYSTIDLNKETKSNYYIEVFKVDIYGNGWPSFKKHKIHKYIKNKKLSEVIAQSNICLNILKKQNLGAHNMRTFEIPSMKGLMLTTRSYEQNKIFPENKASLMFENTEELNKKIEYIFNNPKKIKKIKDKGFLMSKKHRYSERLKFLIRFIDENKKYSNF